MKNLIMVQNVKLNYSLFRLDIMKTQLIIINITIITNETITIINNKILTILDFIIIVTLDHQILHFEDTKTQVRKEIHKVLKQDSQIIFIAIIDNFNQILHQIETIPNLSSQIICLVILIMNLLLTVISMDECITITVRFLWT